MPWTERPCPWELEALRNHYGYVPQDVFLFSDTIGNNIAFGVRDPHPLEARVRQAAEDAGVAQDILAFEHGFDTMLGERGVNLSGGQKQRVSIARALIKRPDMLLLDDCLSAVDTETEERILSAIHRQSSTCTLMVSHRLASLRGADRILVLDEGKLVEQGTQKSCSRPEDCMPPCTSSSKETVGHPDADVSSKSQGEPQDGQPQEQVLDVHIVRIVHARRASQGASKIGEENQQITCVSQPISIEIPGALRQFNGVDRATAIVVPTLCRGRRSWVHFGLSVVAISVDQHLPKSGMQLQTTGC